MRLTLTGISLAAWHLLSMSLPESAHVKPASQPNWASVGQRAVPIAVLGVGIAALGWAGASSGTLLSGAVLACVFLLGADALAALKKQTLGWASRVTQARLALVAVLVAALLEPAVYRDAGWMVAGVALLALSLDGVDGFLARRLEECSNFGARFDMEVDAALILVLCLGAAVTGLAGAWVLLLGLMRYLFLLAGQTLTWLRFPLPPSFRRKLVCVWQVGALVVAISPLATGLGAELILLSALAGLVYSFAVDVLWLYNNRRLSYSQ